MLTEDERRLVAGAGAARGVAGRIGRRLAGLGWRLARNEADLPVSLPAPGDPEFGISRGRLMPTHHILDLDDAPAETRRRLQESLVLVHGGMAQNVGPILEMVTEKYLLRVRDRVERTARDEGDSRWHHRRFAER